MIKKRQAKHVRSYLETSTLKRKRRRKRIFARVVFLILSLGFIIGVFFLLKIRALQVDAVEVTGTIQVSATEIQTKAMDAIAISRNMFGLVPSASTLFVDEEELEEIILEEFPAIASVVVHTGLGGKVKIVITERTAAALWCGLQMNNCHQMDSTGYLFLPFLASTSDQIVFKGVLNESEPSLVGSRFLSEKEIAVFASARKALLSMEKEVDYVLCDSDIICVMKISDNGVLKVNPQDDLENAFDRLSSALNSPALSKGKFEYVDLRYGNKLFYKLDDGSAGDQYASGTSATTSVATSSIPAMR